MKRHWQRILTKMRPVDWLVLGALAVFGLVQTARYVAAATDKVPGSLVYQGRLTNGSGAALTVGNYDIKFEYFDAAQSGNLKCDWTSTNIAVAAGGHFRAEIGGANGSGSCTDIQSVIKDNGTLYLSISIKPSGGGSFETLAPRVKVGAVARAHHAQYAVSSNNGVAHGTIVAYGATTAPEGWLLCDGSAVSRATYATLFSAIGTSFGAGDGTSTFNLPDFRGRFLRGWANGQSIDPDRAGRTANNNGNSGDKIGSLQSTAIWGHNHVESGNGHRHGLSRGGNCGSGCVDGTIFQVGTTHTEYTTYSSIVLADPSATTFGTPVSSSESRPPNVNVNYVIKY